MEVFWSKKQNKQLIEALLALETTDEAKRFVRDLMTEGEIEEFARRIEAARLLSQNIQYTAIVKSTGLSSTTIARVSKWLKGPLGGYRLVLDRLSSKHYHHSHTSVGKGLALRTES